MYSFYCNSSIGRYAYKNNTENGRKKVESALIKLFFTGISAMIRKSGILYPHRMLLIQGSLCPVRGPQGCFTRRAKFQ